GQMPASLVKELSLNRANAVKEAVVRKFNLSPNQFAAEGVGWDRPADAGDPMNHGKNRRVEVRVFAAERQ
ncbi:MAG: OmpA family protein, partial [Deltaproteobacteria bacterium]|nr:OmpA family protein [Deltaproteobacteria bacterium]